MPTFKHQLPDGSVEYHCCRCKMYKTADAFYPSAIERYYPYCKACQTVRRRNSSRRTDESVAALYLYNSERTHVGRYGDATTPRPLDLVREVLAAWDNKSAISGTTGALRVRRLWADLPLSADNAVPVTGGESHRMGRARTPDALLALFPEDAQTRLRATRERLLGHV
jgi:hypothetical protein